jgi:hypothetical protein
MKRPERVYVDAPWGDCCVVRVTAYLPDAHWGGWLSVQHLTDHVDQTLRGRLRRVWRTWRGEPDTSVCIETVEELDGLAAALREMRPLAFPDAP